MSRDTKRTEASVLRPWDPRSRVGLKIALALLVVIAGTLGVHLMLHNPGKMLSEQKAIEARTLGDLVVSIINMEMLAVAPTRVTEHLEFAAHPESVRDIRVIGAGGVVWYSMVGEELGMRLERDLEDQCSQCHAGGEGIRHRSLLWTNSDGEQVFSFHYPIENRLDCQECHGTESATLGKVLLDMRIMPPDLEALSLNRRLASSATVLLILVFFCTGVVVHFIVTVPIRNLVRTTHMIEAGYFDVPFPKASKDEVGQLTESFERMSVRIGDLVHGQEDEIRRQTEELRVSQQLLLQQEKMSALSRLTAGVAHEVGNPLASISAIAQLIERTTQEQETGDRAAELNGHVQRISRIVRELVDVHRPGLTAAGWVDLHDSFDSALGVARYDRNFSSIEVRTDIAPDCPRIFAVEDHILQILLNLVFNAVDAMEDGGRLELVAGPARGGVEIVVGDTGMGIAAEDLDSVFDPFFTTKPVGKGTGLGMWVTFSLLKQAGGTISLESEPGEGTEARVWLPISQGAAGDDVPGSGRR